MSDFAVSPDFAMNGDMAGRDLATPTDLTAPPDLTTPRDLSTPRDLTAPPDLSTPPDFAGADLTSADFAGAPDLSCDPAQCTSPPANDCQGATSRVFPNPGSCGAGGCTYTPATTSCQYGCYQSVCSAQLSFIGNRAAFQTGTGNSVALVGGSAPSGNSVSVIVQTYPHGAAQMVQLFYTTDDFASTNMLTMLPDPNTPAGNNDQWYAIIPAQSMGTHVIWYMLATGWDATQLYDSNSGANYDYTSN